MSLVKVTIELRPEEHSERDDVITIVTTRNGAIDDGVIEAAASEATTRARAASTAMRGKAEPEIPGG